MFLKVSEFKRLLQEAYKGAGVKMGHTTNGTLYMAGYFWTIEIYVDEIPKKALAHIIELEGRIPAEGETCTMAKGQEIQMDIPWHECYAVMLNAEECENSVLESTGLMIDGARIMQKESGGIIAIDDRFTANISNLYIDEAACHTPLKGPYYDKNDRVYWKNNVMAMMVSPIILERNKHLIRTLERFDIRNDGWIDVSKEENEEAEEETQEQCFTEE